jgi:hypothetical protein
MSRKENKMNLNWIMEVNVKPYIYELPCWKAVHPTGGNRYEYDTKEEALRMLRILYPDSVYDETIRVRQLKLGE